MTKVLILICLFASSPLWAKSFDDFISRKVQYKTYFGKCPSKVAGSLTLTLMREFEKTQSLKKVKELIIKDKLDERYFLSSYKVDYQPTQKLLTFRYDCPSPLLKVQIYKENGDEYYTAILVDNGKLYDPTYEVLLRSENKLTKQLANLAISIEQIEKDKHLDVTKLLKDLDPNFTSQFSEVILDEQTNLTLILSIDGRASSVFMGSDYWSEKVEKLVKVIDFMKKKKSIPAVINLTNSKKVVVKFSDSI